MKTSRTCLGATKITFEFQASFAMYGFALWMMALMPFPLHGAQYYTNWATTNFSDIPAFSGPTADPDQDGEANLVEFAFGTDPRAPGGIAGAVQPVFGGTSGTNAVFQVQILEREGHQPGVQIDLYLSADLVNWFRPWWQRTTTNSLPGDPTDSVRELFSTRLPGTNVWFVRAKVQLVEGGAETVTYYVATSGSDSTNSGTSIAAPFATLAKAVGLANPGDLIYVRGGTYVGTARIRLTRSGSATQPIRVRAYPGEHPTFDFSGQTFSSSNRGFEIPGNWWQLYGLEIFGAGDNGLNISGNSNVVKLCVFHDCRDTGLQINSPGSGNLVLNCDSYHNYDTGTHGENADGFAPKLAGLGPNNVFRGCRAWENADDGWDTFAAPNAVLIEDCWSFRNGFNVVNDPLYAGDGNGFKLGGDNVPAPHRIVNCVSFSNTHHGFDQNNNTAGLTVDQNTAWGNGTINGNNFNLNHGSVTQGMHVVRNNLSINGSVTFYPTTVQTSNSWQVVTSPAAGNSDVLSVDDSFALAPRRDDGGLPENPFLRPVPTGRLVNKGMDIGSPFVGSAPDLGAYETTTW
jgi:hypothetical protein